MRERELKAWARAILLFGLGQLVMLALFWFFPGLIRGAAAAALLSVFILAGAGRMLYLLKQYPKE